MKLSRWLPGLARYQQRLCEQSRYLPGLMLPSPVSSSSKKWGLYTARVGTITLQLTGKSRLRPHVVSRVFLRQPGN